MTAARDIIQNALTANLDPALVEPYARQLDGLTRPVVMVRLDAVERTPTAGRDTRAYSATVLCVSPLTDDDAAGHDAVDELLEDVLHAVELSPLLTWTGARRVTVDDTWPAWEVDLKPVPTKHTQEGTP